MGQRNRRLYAPGNTILDTAVAMASDAYYFEGRRPHRFRCIGNKPCEVISACTPPTF
jgi:hypothetical protein